jgi:hypothetical protein
MVSTVPILPEVVMDGVHPWTMTIAGCARDDAGRAARLT